MRYYEVEMVKKNPYLSELDERSLLLAVESRAAAKEQADKVKAFLYGDKDTTGYAMSIYPFNVVNGDKSQTKYYKISFYKPYSKEKEEEMMRERIGIPGSIIVKAKNKADAQKQAEKSLLEERESPENYDFTVKEKPIKNLISEAWSEIHDYIEEEYNRENPEVYKKAMAEDSEELWEEMEYEMLLAFIKKHCC